MIEGWYYLHENGDLIYKRELGETAADIRESPFARAMWPIDRSDRAGAWRILVEGLAAGANRGRVFDLAGKWRCDDEDAKVYADRLGIVVQRDGDAWFLHRKDFINIAESPAGFGRTMLEALADLAKHLGYRPALMWGNSLHDLVKAGGAALESKT